VVLVGRTGIDAALRADPSLELVRIHETLDAIGEVAFATSSHDNPPVVVIAPDVLDSLKAEKNPSCSDLRDFVDALRVANPGVRIVGVSEDGQADAAMDGMLKAPASPESIRRVLFASARVEPPIVEVVRTEPRAKAEDADKNAAIFHALLQGKSPLECAMELIRERLGDSSIRFVHETESSSHVRCAVEWSGVLFGYLSSMNTAEREVMPQAKCRLDRVVRATESAPRSGVHGSPDRRLESPLLREICGSGDVASAPDAPTTDGDDLRHRQLQGVQRQVRPRSRRSDSL
jgi:hypothetical protein